MAGKAGNRTRKKQPMEVPAASFKNEVMLWAVLAISIILFISNFGIAGGVGDFFSGLFFGIFGLAAYIFPLVLFAGTVFVVSNRDNPAATVKIVASIVFFIFICMFLELITGNSKAASPIDSFLWARKGRLGGGLLGGLLTWLIRPNLGTVSAYIINIIVLIICLILITQRSLWKPIKSGSKKAYHAAKDIANDISKENAEKKWTRQHQQYAQPRQRRMDNKVVGVSMDTSMKEIANQRQPGAVRELHPKENPVVDFPIHMMDGTSPKEQEKDPDKGQETGQNTEPGPKIGQDEVPEDEIPIVTQKVVLKPSMHTPIDEADQILEKTSELFSEMLPKMNSGTADPESIALGENTGLEPGKESRYSNQGIEPASGYSDGSMGSASSFSNQSIEPASEYSNGNREPTSDDSDEDFELASRMPDESFEPSDVFNRGMESASDDSAGSMGSANGYSDKGFRKAGGGSAESSGLAGNLENGGFQKKSVSIEERSGMRNGFPDEKAGPGNGLTSDRSSSIEAPKEVVKREYVFPDVSLLESVDTSKTGDSRQHLQETALKLQQTLKNFGVNVTILNVSCGPSVTRYEIQPEMGVKVSKIVGLSDDIKLNLAAADIRIEAPIPGKAAIGIEVPNKENVPVMFRSLIESEEFRQFKSPCTFAVGKDIAGKVVVTDICKMPHLLIAGATGSGKSVCINTIIMSILYKANPDDVKLIMVDPKVVELSVYNGIPHLLLPVVTDPKKAAGALHWAVSEMMGRYKKFEAVGVRDIKGYNAKIKKIEDIEDENKPQKMSYIVIIVDELADLMMAAPGDVEDAICRLAQLARAAGIHLIIATQRPSVNVITGLIKANMPSRIAFSVTSGTDSRTILDMNGAEKLLGKGDMLFYPQGVPKPVRVQGAFVTDSEVTNVTEFLKEQNGATQYSKEIEEQVSNSASSSGMVAVDAAPADDKDVYFADAAKLLIEKDKASVSMLQRHFKIGFNRAARIMDQLEEAGVVGAEEGTKPRKILMSPEEFAQYEEEVL